MAHAVMNFGHASVVITANVLVHSAVAGSFQLSTTPPMPKGLPSFIAIA